MQRSDDDVARDRKIIREEVKTYVAELLVESGVEDKNPWQWALGIIACIAKWERRAGRAFDLTWQTLLVLSLGGVAAWLATAFKLWSGAGWQ